MSESWPTEHSPGRAKHCPERTCVACRTKRPQAELLRLTRLPLGWSVQQQHRTGRGVYVCADNPACWSEKKLRRAFGAQAPGVAQDLLNRREAQHEPLPDQPMNT